MDLKGKKIAVIGAGVEGISTVNYLVSNGAKVSLLDKKSISDFETEKIAKLNNLPVQLVLSKDYLANLASFDIIIRSPGVKLDLPEIIAAKAKGVTISSQTKLFFSRCPCPIIGVTGTKGKGTTSSLIFRILKSAGKKVFLGGNIGTPPLDFADQVTADSLVVLELSSFQLADLDKSPEISVVLMITSEHLDWHKDTAEYFKAKESIVRYQNENDFVVINNDFQTSKKLGAQSRAKKYYFSTKGPVEKGAYLEKEFIVSVTNGWTTILKTEDVLIPGLHNLQNICAAVAVAGILGVKPEIIGQEVKIFKGLPHRLELVGKEVGTTFYNDSASTTPETAIAAIKAFRETKIVILGGSSKNSDFTELGKTVIENNVKAVILIGEESKRIKKTIQKAGSFSGELVEGLKTMKEIVAKAREIAVPGDIVILSPACASFGMFKNYEDRGNQFKQAVISS